MEVPRRIFVEQLEVRYAMRGLPRHDIIVAPTRLQAELILRTAVPFLRD